MRQHLVRSLLVLLLTVAPAHAVTIAVGGSETFLVESFPMPSVAYSTPLPLDLAIHGQTGNTIYMLPEFDKAFYSVSRTATDGTTMTQIPIQAPGSPLFRSALSDTGTSVSPQQEAMQATPDGSVWVSQGGNCFTNSINNNWSRIVRQRADGVQEAYTLPVDSACAIGFYASTTSTGNTGLLVAAKGANALYSTTTRSWHEGETTATRYPPIDYRWVTTRQFGAIALFPAKIIKLADSRFAGTLYFATSFFLLDSVNQTYTQIALSAASPTTQPLLGSGPWGIAQHPTDGNIWIAEDYSQRVTKYNINTGVQTVFDLSASLSSDEHPHSLAYDATTDAWYVTTYAESAGGNGRLVKITNSGTVTVGTSFATISNAGGLTGIVRDSAGKLWVAVFRQQKIVRLTRQ